MIHMSQEIQVPNLKKACMKFIQDDNMDIFDSEPTIFQTLTKDIWTEMFKEPWSPIHDKFGRKCDEMETAENLFYILILTLKTSNRIGELPDFIEDRHSKKYLYAIFADPTEYTDHKRLLPRRLEIDDDLKKLVLSFCPKPEKFQPYRARAFWSASPYGTHNDIELTQENHQEWLIEGLIRKINIKSRYDWDGRHIIQGIQVFLENGETQAFGMNLGDTVQVESLVVPDGQHITFFHIRCGFYIDAIGFETNEGQKFGPIGGTGGSLKKHVPVLPNQGRCQPYIDGIRGKTVETQGLPCICAIQFKHVVPYDNEDDLLTDSSVDDTDDDDSDTDDDDSDIDDYHYDGPIYDHNYYDSDNQSVYSLM